jgi:microcystin-dependent protein
MATLLRGRHFSFCEREMTFYKWSQTASADATADSTINWAEGQSPSSVNDSARAMMAATAKYRDDIAGAIVTGGTSTAYTITSYQQFDTLDHLNGQMIAFTPHAMNGATVTLNVDSLGARPLRSAPNSELLAGVLIQGTPYVAIFNNSDGAFYLQGFYGDPYSVPLGGILDFIGSTTPNSSFAFPTGQAISRTTYATLFSLIGTTYGAGDGSTTFNVPDLTGRVVAMKEVSATRLTSTYFGGDSTKLNASGGGESKVLVTANLPPYTPSGTVNTGSLTLPWQNLGFNITTGGSAVAYAGLGSAAYNSFSGFSFTGSPQGGTSTPFRTVQPTIILNKILRIF